MKKVIILAIAMVASFCTFAQKAKSATIADSATVHLKYSCPMHADVTSNEPGKCTKCGMELMLSKKEQMKTAVTAAYGCPMHAGVMNDKAGICPKCGATLTKTNKEQMKMQVMKSFTCPMHPSETSDKAGKCAKCGMDLIANSKKAVPHKD